MFIPGNFGNDLPCLFEGISSIYSYSRLGLVAVADFSIALDRLLKEESPARRRPYQLQAVDRVWIRHDGGSAPQRVQRNDLLFEDVLPNVQERFSLKRSRSAARAWQSIFPSVKMGRSMSARSHLELQQLKLCEVDGAVRRFVEQPIRIVYRDGQGKLRSHTPDLFVERETHSEFIEVKWERDARAPKNEARWPFIASAISALGFLVPGGLTSAGHLRGVSRTSAELFDQQYISSTAISRRYGLSAISVTRRILATGVTPILEGHSSARYQFCWRRSDIEKIDFKSHLRNRHGRRHNAPKLDYVDLTLRESEADGSAVFTRLALTFLGTNAASLRAAIDKGLLSAARISAKGSVLAVHADEVRQFAAQYAYTPKLSSELGISENALLKTLKLRGAVPVLPGKAPVQSLWRRAELNLTDLLGLNAVHHEVELEPASLPLWA
ncbi:TnsA endonuclease N-terminal domain-containing protein [Brevundimonas faecalis]|uniref:TnsA endonuclease N-terminal domain-containing protein n=1 Tax=Brevundimonas faecalis TaxID=947378 RepID=UPI003618759B